MTILFIDTGWKDLGFAQFDLEDGELINSISLTLDKRDHKGRIASIIDMLDFFNPDPNCWRVVYENYTVRDDSTGKSKKGQKTLFCNGIIEGYCRARKIDTEEINHNDWKAIYKRYKLDHTLKGLPVLSPPEAANDHASDAFKMGIAWLVRERIVK